MDALAALFDDLVDPTEESAHLLRFLRERLPFGRFQVLQDRSGGVCIGDELLPPEDLPDLRPGEGGGPSVPSPCLLPSGHPACILPVAELKVTVVCALPERPQEPGISPAVLSALGSGVEVFLSRRELRQVRGLLRTQKGQFDRRYRVLEEKYRDILNDNHRGYQIIKKQQSAYSRKLKSEITRQTGELQETNDRLSRAKRELEQSNLQLEQAIAHAKEMAEKAEAANLAKGQFLASMSHEIRTPMNAVIGYTDMLFDTPLSEEQSEYAATIRQSAESLLTLINDILDFSKIEAGQMDLDAVDFDPELTVYSVCDLLRPRVAGKPIEILCRIDDALPPLVNGDPGRFRQVLVNLMGNAAKFTDAGEIELCLDVAGESDEEIELHAHVRDSGIGIPEKQQKQIFEAFRQADGSTTRKYEGTGLGLSICEKLVGLMKGRLWVESRPGKGSSFHFTARLRKSGSEMPLEVPSLSLQGKRAFILDVNKTGRDILTHLLQSYGMRVSALETADGVPFALQEALRGGDPFHVGLIGLQALQGDAREWAKRIRNQGAETSHLPLIALSSGTERIARWCREAGFDGLLPKPVRRDKLRQMLSHLVSESGSMQRDDPREGIITRFSIAERHKRSIRILLAEDNPVNQKLALLLLSRAGYRAEAVCDGKEALERYLSEPRGFDVILMDIQMPGMDGLTATREIRNRERAAGKGEDHRDRIPIIAMTANAMKGDREICLEAGMDDYIPKPIRREQVFRLLEKWVFQGGCHESRQTG
ncbi:MAG: response regulator [Deltaproteobacteria bacterium]|nr:response regulator [Deltaproteobacteria bacterium]